MWNYPTTYDVIVIGAGHAGCEAAHAAAKMQAKTLLLTMNLDTIAKMSCNPSIGGTAKGHIVREIDALGGIMGKIADETGIHFRMLNASKGPAVRSPRAQADKHAYHSRMKQFLETLPHLEIKQGTATSLLITNGVLLGVETQEGTAYLGKTVIIASGTFMNGTLFIGHTAFPGGRGGESPSLGLSDSLKRHGLDIGRLKTGTPPRINRRSIDFSLLEEQPGEENVHFSYDPQTSFLPKKSCFITYTTPETKNIIQNNLKKSALFSGLIRGVGPRYCPSIEDKIVRFAEKERHQVFLEPEGLHTEEIYLNGVSSSMPFEVQLQVIRSILGLENAEIMRPAYAIEYDFIKSGQIFASLETKKIENLFLAGQINGTTGYEEAAAQGLVAGINAALKALGKSPCFFNRSESYIGVLIDDLITKPIDEPYRMFTSRAEHRLLLRQDNADLRLRSLGYHLGLISAKQHELVEKKKKAIQEEKVKLSESFTSYQGKYTSLAQLLCRPEYSYETLLKEFPKKTRDHGKETNEQIEIELKYDGYIVRQQREIEKLSHLEKILIPKNFSFSSVKGLRNEAKEKFSKHTPETFATASQISGISPADLSILLVALKNFLPE